MSFLRFPGVVGSYLSTPDVNLLDADTAHIVQSQPWTATTGTVSDAGIQPDGWGSVLVTATGDPVLLRRTGQSIPMTAEDYTLSCTVDNRTGSDKTCSPVLITSGGSFQVAPITIPAGVSRVSMTRELVDGTITEIRFTFGGSATGEYLVSKFTLRKGTDASFVPSLNIVGLSSVVVDPADMQWSYTAGDEFQIGDGWAGDGISLVSRDGPGGPIVAEFQVPDIGIEEGAIPPGTQWQDTTGRTWTSSGSLEILDWLYGYPVEDLAAYLDAALPDGVQVYSHAADIGKLPAVVLVPGNPAIALTTMAGAEMTLAWGIEATLVVNRSQPLYGTRLLFDLWRQIATACIAYSETVQVLTLEEIGTVEWSGGEAMAGTMPMILTQSEGT